MSLELLDEILCRKESRDLILAGKIARNEVQIVRIDNVFKYVMQWVRDVERDHNQIPNAAPPFPWTWFEWALTSDHGDGVIRKMGCSVASTTEPWPASIMTMAHPPQDHPDTKWRCLASMYALVDGMGYDRMGDIMYNVLPEGKISPTSPDGFATFIDTSNISSDRQDFKDFVCMSVFVPWMATALMHCKNVEQVKSPPISPELQRARERKGKPPLLRFKTLRIEPFGQQKMSVGTANGYREESAFHICRGHFKTFKEDAPLFGKLTGTYWWPMHTRGDRAHGEVRKDYEVKT